MKVGWIGAGNMGNPMAVNMLPAASEFRVHDIRPEVTANLQEMGAEWSDSPAQIARDSDVVVMSLPMPHHVEAVCLGTDGVMEGVDSDSIVIDLSTNASDMVATLQREFMEQKGVRFLDAPVSGGVQGAIDQDLCVMVGGDEDAYHEVKPILDAMGDKVMYCGPSGTGTTCKLMNNVVGTMIYSCVVEVLTAGAKTGIDLKTLATAIAGSTGGKNRPFDAWADGTFDRSFEADEKTFYLELALKDVRLACELGALNGVPMDIANLVRQRLVEANARGWGREKMYVYRTLQEERADVVLGDLWQE